MMKVTVLGSGTSQGVPVIACSCEVCTSKDEKDKRLRSSVLLEKDGFTLVIDTGPDFRQQMLKQAVKKLDAVLFTHEHKDHISGLDDVRAFNYFSNGKAIDLYMNNVVEAAIKREFYYIFSEPKYPGIPLVNIHPINLSPFSIGPHHIQPIEVYHYMMPVYGYRFGNFCYVTDAKRIAEDQLAKMRNLDTLFINALRRESHISHFTLKEAIDLIQQLKPKRAYLTHISHQMGLHAEVESMLPENIKLAYDGLSIEV